MHTAMGVLVSMTSETVNVIGEKNQSPITQAFKTDLDTVFVSIVLSCTRSAKY